MTATDTAPTGRTFGTCQACFRTYSVTPDRRMVHHGFRRPGDGYIHGDCLGVNAAPLELSRELSDAILATDRAEVVRLKARLADLQHGVVQELQIVKKLQKYAYSDPATGQYTSPGEGWERDRNYWRKTVAFAVRPGHEPSADRGEYYSDTWERYLQNAVRRVESDIEYTEGSIATREKLTKNWAPHPEKLVAKKPGSERLVHTPNPRRPGEALCRRPSWRGQVSHMQVTLIPADVTCAKCRRHLNLDEK